jgi:hypothetical protein
LLLCVASICLFELDLKFTFCFFLLSFSNTFHC